MAMVVVGSVHGFGLPVSVVSLQSCDLLWEAEVAKWVLWEELLDHLNDRGLYLKSMGRGMVFGMLIWSRGFSEGWTPLGSNLGNHSFLFLALHFLLQSNKKVRKSAFCLQGTLSPGM